MLNCRQALAAILLAASMTCSQQSAANEAFKVRFTWKIKGEYAPFYMAQAKGLFSSAGLDLIALRDLQRTDDGVHIPGHSINYGM